MDNYLLLGHQIMREGRKRGDRTGTGTKSIRSAKLVFDMRKGFPLVTTKKVNLEYVFRELKWILLGRSDVQYLEEHGCGFIWRDWSLSEPVMEEIRYADWQRLEVLERDYPEAYAVWVEEGYAKRPVAEGHAFMDKHDVPTHWERVKIPAGETNAPYGPRWRKWKGRDGKTYDQIAYVLDLLRTNPESRRILISTWDPADMPDESISPQANIANGKPCLTPCFVPGSLVLTPYGYAPIETLQADDVVITGSGNQQSINRVWVTPHDGEVLSIKVAYQKPTIDCTTNHPFLVKDRGYVEAGQLKVGDLVAILKPKTFSEPFTYYYTQRHGNSICQKSRTFSTNDYYTFGYFVGNGWVSDFMDRIAFAIPNSKKDDILPRIRDTIKVTEKPNCGVNVTSYQTSSKMWWPVFNEFGRGALNKCIPEWILNAPDDCLDAFLEGYRDADGCKGKSGSDVFTTVSSSLAYGLQRLYARKGVVARIYLQKRPPTTMIEGRIVNQNDTYLVEVPKTNTLHHVIHEESYVWVPVESINKYQYTGDVYNLDVGTDHTYVVQNIVNHNCHWSVEFYTDLMTTEERVSWLVERNPLAWDKWVDNDEANAEGALEIYLDMHNVPKRYLDLKWHQRSVDFCVGLSYNIASYGMLLMMFATTLNMVPRELEFDGTNVHIYSDHIPGFTQQFSRAPRPSPHLEIITKRDRLEDYEWGDFLLTGYHPHPFIKYEVSV